MNAVREFSDEKLEPDRGSEARAAVLPIPNRLMLGSVFLYMVSIALCGCQGRGDGRVHAQEVERGRRLIVAYGCGACHQIDGIVNASGKVGPTLNGIALRTLIAGKLVNTTPNMRRWLMDPPSITPGTAMPDLYIDDSTASAMTAYLSTLK